MDEQQVNGEQKNGENCENNLCDRVNCTSFLMPSKDGKNQLYCKRWKASDDKEPKCLIFLCHGFGEHILYYEKIAQELVDRLDALVLAHDHLGHGQSEGSRGQIKDVSQYVDDVLGHIDQVKQKWPQLPVFIMGHSMGGTITVKSVNRSPEVFKGVILVGPAVKPSGEAVVPWKKALSGALGRYFPNIPVLPLNFDHFTRDTDHVQKRKDDTLCYRKYAKAGWCAAMIEATEDIAANFEKITWPFLVFHGECDKILDCAAAKEMHEKAASKDKTLKIFDKAYHNLMYEIDDIPQQMMNQTVEWIQKRM